MYQHLKSLAVFIAVAESGAFNRAAAKLNLQPSVVSHHISKLEEHLGVTLFYRTTRRVSLSDQGESLYRSMRPLYQQCEQHLEQLAGSANTPSGKLSIALPQVIPCPKLTRALWQFVKDHPDIELTMHYSDRRSELPHSEIDLALRIGRQPDSSLRTLQLSSVRHRLVVAPELCAGRELSFEDIEQLPAITMKLSGEMQLNLSTQTQQRALHYRNIRLRVDNIRGAREAALAGIGFASLPPLLCQDAIEAGELIELLPQWQLPGLPINATWPGKARRNTLIRLFIEYLQRTIK
ncbi:MAG: LysR family transcriptional regulator [Pseudomonadales bacterium]